MIYVVMRDDTPYKRDSIDIRTYKTLEGAKRSALEVVRVDKRMGRSRRIWIGTFHANHVEDVKEGTV